MLPCHNLIEEISTRKPKDTQNLLYAYLNENIQLWDKDCGGQAQFDSNNSSNAGESKMPFLREFGVLEWIAVGNYSVKVKEVRTLNHSPVRHFVLSPNPRASKVHEG